MYDWLLWELPKVEKIFNSEAETLMMAQWSWPEKISSKFIRTKTLVAIYLENNSIYFTFSNRFGQLYFFFSRYDRGCQNGTQFRMGVASRSKTGGKVFNKFLSNYKEIVKPYTWSILNLEGWMTTFSTASILVKKSRIPVTIYWPFLACKIAPIVFVKK